VAAVPLTYLAMSRWLDTFVYRVDLAREIFLASGLLALVIAFLTVSYQALGTAMVYPVQALRNE